MRPEVAPARESSADEVARLRRCVNDLVGLVALPALWEGGAPARVAATLLDAVYEVLDVSFAFVRLDDADGGPPVEMARAGAPLAPGDSTQVIGRMLDRSLGSAASKWPPSARVSLGDTDLWVAAAPLGLRSEFGVVVAGCRRADFPGQTERLLLDVAANQGAVGLQHARRLREERWVATELDDRVARRTRELAAANAELAREVEERRRAEAALRQSGREARLIVDTIPGIVCVLSADGALEFMNRQGLEYFGLTLEDMQRWAAGGVTHPEDLARGVEHFSRSIAAGEPWDVEVRGLRADGAYRWTQTRGAPLRDASGRVVRWYNLIVDIDERRRAEEALAASERDLKLIIDTMPALAWSALPDGSADFLSQHFLDFVGLTAEEAQGWGWTAAIHPDDRDRQIATWSEILASGMPGELEARLRRADGEYRWLLYRGRPLRDAGGRIVKWYGVNTDIEDRKRAEAALAANERNLKLTIDTIPALAWTATTDGGGEFFNQHYLDYVGLSADQARGLGWTARVHPDDLPGLIAAWQRIMAAAAPGEAEARMCRPDGEYRWFLFRVNPLRDEGGRITRWYGVNTDIEDRKRAEAGLRRAYDSFADGQRLSKTGNFTADIVVDEHQWSDELYRIFEFAPGSKITVERVREVILPDDLPSFDAGFARSLGGEEFDLVFRIATAGGGTKHVRALAHLVERVAGRPLFIGAIQDVTESRVAEEALNRARSELAHVARVATLSTLTASIAHEVNQPLSGIVTNAGTCLRMLDAVPPNIDGARETARRTIRDGHRAADVITRLRALFGKREFTREPLDLNDAVGEVVALSLGDLQRGRVVLRTELSDGLPLVVGDRVQLQQVVLNLLLNAAEAMSDVTDRTRELTVRTEREGEDRVRVIVRDAGVGVDRANVERLFDAFHTTKPGGMGIGLSVSRSILERHGGRLWVEPNDGPGATFTFEVPCRPEGPPDDAAPWAGGGTDTKV